MVSALINIPKIDTSDFRNLAIRNAYSNKHYEVVDLLWCTKKVQESLKNDDFNLYQSLLHT